MKYEVNGKIEDDISKIRGIQELAGVKAKNMFAVASEQELEEKLTEMTLVDLQRMAVSCGISGGGTRMVLKSKIRNEFLKFTRGGHGYAMSKTETGLTGKNIKKREAKVKKLIGEGL